MIISEAPISPLQSPQYDPPPNFMLLFVYLLVTFQVWVVLSTCTWMWDMGTSPHSYQLPTASQESPGLETASLCGIETVLISCRSCAGNTAAVMFQCDSPVLTRAQHLTGPFPTLWGAPLCLGGGRGGREERRRGRWYRGLIQAQH